MDPELLPIGDDVDTSGFLVFEPLDNRFLLGFYQFLALDAPRRPELLRFGQPIRLGQTSCCGCFQHSSPFRPVNGP